MALIRLATPLRRFSGGKPEISADGATLLDIIQNIDRTSPGFAEKVLENGELKRFLNVYINNEDVRFGKGLKTEIGKQDVVSILPAVSGG